MEQNQINSQQQTPAPVPDPKIISEKSTPGYFTRLFSGRLNRQNYVIGSTVFVLVPLICFMIVIFNILLSPDTFDMPSLSNNLNSIEMPQVSIISLLQTPANKTWSAIGILFVILSIPYLFSIQIKRLHDLNLSGWLWIINIVPLLFINSMFSLTDLSHPGLWFWVGNFASTISSFFSLYISLWPGTKGPNKFGDPPLPRSSFLKDVLVVK